MLTAGGVPIRCGANLLVILKLLRGKQLRPKGRSFVVEFLPLPLSCFDEVPLTCGKNSPQAEPMASNGFSTLSRH